MTKTQLDEAQDFTGDQTAQPPGGDTRTRATLLLARAISPSPVAVDAGVVASCRDAELSAPAIVELVTWLAVLQLLHRLTSYYAPDTEQVVPAA